MTTIPLLKQEWRVSFELKANKFSGLQQILHMTRGGKGSGSGSKYGDRTPAIWTHSSKGFLISSAVNGKYSYSKYLKPLPALGIWTKIEVGQQLVGSKMVYSITIGGRKVFSVSNSKPSEFENVKVYASSDWYSPLSGSIKNLLIQNKNDGELTLILKTNSFCPYLGSDSDGCLLDWTPSFSLPDEHLLAQNTLLTTLPTLDKEWRLTFEVNPTSYTYKSFAQIVQLTIGGKSSAVGDRTPSLWFHRSRGVYLATTLSGRTSVGRFFKGKLPPIDQWTRFEIKQEKRGTTFFFSFLIEGQELWSIPNTKPRRFQQVKVYAGSPWYVAQTGSIKGLQIEQKMRGTNLWHFQKNLFVFTVFPWTSWGTCMKNRTRPQHCSSEDYCSPEVEMEQCEAGVPSGIPIVTSTSFETLDTSWIPTGWFFKLCPPLRVSVHVVNLIK